ncbi:hypothetical protein ACMX2H_07580 [Arthrobacter sulfonylureivorans]|uniref:hypothetical protein n=1 Tax=Arthrobacter sulfonylureivorans TaxID=2486855 RepID=UPI0039E376B7
MHVNDQEFVYQGLSVTYKFRRALQDRRHLLVVFSGGFGPKRGYDLNGSVVDGIRTDILWIRDTFDGDFSYYIRTHRRGTLVAEAVAALIDKIRLERGLERHHCTLFGISKGASGALYHALANDYPNVIAVSPRMRIGSGNQRLRPDILKQMVGDATDDAVAQLDDVLPSLLMNDPNRTRNVYLFTSPSDGQYKTEILPYLAEYERYENFNFILTDSPLVQRHRDVASYNIPLLLATIAALGEGAVPRYGQVRNGIRAFESSVPQPSLAAVRERHETVCMLTSLTLRDNRFYPEGLLFVKGQSTRGPGQLSRKLVLASDKRRKTYGLESVPDDKLSRTYFENEFCDYSRGRFATRKRSGIDVSALPPGRYSLGLILGQGGESVTVDAVRAEPQDAALVSGKHLVRLHSTGTTVELYKGSVLDEEVPGSLFEMGSSWARGNRVHLEGSYVLPGFRSPRRNDVRYYLVLAKAGSRTAVVSYQLATSRKDFDGGKLGDPLGNYGFTCFGTPSGAGLELNNVGSGEYDLYVTAVAGSVASSHAAGLRLTITGVQDDAECRLQATKPVPGGRLAAAWVAGNSPRLARRIRRDLGRVKRRILSVKR